MLNKDSNYFHELQSQTGWGHMLASFARWCAPKPGWRVLDVGCGPGLLPAIFAQAGCHAYGTGQYNGYASGEQCSENSRN